jgi:hypothetical protein
MTDRLMSGGAEIIMLLYECLDLIDVATEQISENERAARSLTRRDPIRVEMYLDRNADEIRELRDTVSHLRRLIEERLRPKLKRRAQLDAAADDSTLTSEVKKLREWVAELRERVKQLEQQGGRTQIRAIRKTGE